MVSVLDEGSCSSLQRRLGQVQSGNPGAFWEDQRDPAQGRTERGHGTRNLSRHQKARLRQEAPYIHHNCSEATCNADQCCGYAQYLSCLTAFAGPALCLSTSQHSTWCLRWSTYQAVACIANWHCCRTLSMLAGTRPCAFQPCLCCAEGEIKPKRFGLKHPFPRSLHLLCTADFMQ